MFGQEAIVWCRYSLMLPCVSSIESCPTVEPHVDELTSVWFIARFKAKNRTVFYKFDNTVRTCWGTCWATTRSWNDAVLCCRASRLSAIAPMSVGNRGLSKCWTVHSNSSCIVLVELVWDCILIESQNLCPTESVRPHGCSEAAKMKIIKLDRLWHKMPTPKGVAGRIFSHWLAKNAVQPLFPPIHTYVYSTNPTSKHWSIVFFSSMVTSTSGSNPQSNQSGSVIRHNPISYVQRLVLVPLS